MAELEGVMAHAQDSKSIQQMRLKAKAFVSQHQPAFDLDKAKKSIDPNNFTCTFCNGTVDSASNKFIHDKICINY